VSLRRALYLLATVALGVPAAASAQTPAYQVPSDNPFVGVPGARPEVFVYGMRNPYRWSFDRQTGDMYIGDVGGIREEITYVPRANAAGANLGWNCFSGTAVQAGCTPPAYVRPAFEYPSSADVVIGGYVVRDPALPALQGQYLFGRFQTGQIRRLGPGAAGPEQTTGAAVPSVSSLGEDGLGHLYATSLSGPVYRLQANGGGLTAVSIGGFSQPVAVAAPPGDGERLFVVERAGRVQLRTGTQVSLFLDIANLVGDSGGEEGLLAFAVAPDYGASGRVFAFYTDSAGDLQLDEFRRTATGPDRSDPATRRPVLTIAHGQADNHNGGQLLFGADNRLYLSTGDGGTQGDPEGDAQNLGSLLGKILRIDVGPAGPSPTPLPATLAADNAAPRLRVTVKRRQRVLRLRGVVAYARCDERCSVAAGGVLRLRGRALRLRRVTRAGRASRRVRLKVRLSRRSARALRRAAARRRRASVRIGLRATDAAGNRSRLVRARVRVLRRRR
jgi:glucose/arabinose dehydrogenase